MSNSSDAPLPQTQSLRRSVTLPSKLITRPRRQSESLRPSENDLFYHPSAKVVHFAPRALAPIPSSTAPSDFDYPVDTVETLPWRSPTERTVALGPLRLENVHGLTVFLKCGNVVHAILKNSQCWCVDGESTFVLRIRPLTYYRIELPADTDDNKVLVTEMKNVLPRVLRYEVTPCPFKRGFTVEIPEEAKAPRRKRAWRPKGRRESAPISSVYYHGLSKSKEDLTKDSVSAGEDTDGEATDDSGFSTKASNSPSNSTILETIPDDNESPEAPQTSEQVDLPTRPDPEPEQNFQTLLARFEDKPKEQVDPETTFSSSVESFHSLGPSLSTLPELDACSTPTSTEGTEQFQPEHSDTHSPSEEQPFQETERSRDRLSVYVDCWDDLSPASHDMPGAFHEREVKPIPTIVPDIQRPVARRAGTTDSNPNLSSMSIEFRRRSKASREREVSPMPPASSLAVARPEKHDAASLIHKTCTLVLVPPIQLLVVLIHIAARIVIGPALESAMGELNRKIEYEVDHAQDTVDDFDLPLPDRSGVSADESSD
ncbi:hypothetical protein CBS147320_527 [Aspergillus niger]|uniref:uncharacterized protein n=1 Tax=Aspergillus lacticoffeatus (strain CBS 101883) TaxID=1450533 RepID=UPI000D8015D5|nr:uncharacterized protein BO96DRAFT_411250 [Aspergillus niger CBS 101883]KAI2850314.1 hypothetical protein CBS11350_1616 [Aspergillus niger]KAI2935520.1 hypothetical protein CBS147320_527 [Aspergillus niger]PYH57550.1 hypothetical protein BO96DRAFT_411250 [Aspergillus niger CBS 101883]GJP92400.1 inheritance of peroxisomes protein 1-domain-containing protein [Aspergillus niger]